MENCDKIMQFSLSPEQLHLRNILSKEFLEMDIWAISTIDPNRNKTHFTLESLEKCVPNCKNKPIVGFFNKEDFEEHNGKKDYDPELRKSYWNTENGERILGIIRESDPVEIVKSEHFEEDGIYWLHVRCILFVQYCYKQVKRLLKDKHKTVSVEVTVHESEMRDDGVEEIYDFTLNGITILGSKNGIPVLEAIPGAHCMVLSGVEDDAIEEQKKMLSFAYCCYDNGQIDNIIDSLGHNDPVGECGEPGYEANQGQNADAQNSTDPDGEQKDNLTSALHTENECGAELNNGGNAEMENVNDQAVCEEMNATDNATVDTQVENETQAAEPVVEEQAVNSDPTTETFSAGEGASDDNAAGEPVGQDPVATVDNSGAANDGEQMDFAALKELYDTLSGDYAKKCEECDALREANDTLTHTVEQYADYDSIKQRMEAAEKTVWEHFCGDMKRLAMEKLECECDIATEKRDEIIMKASNGDYACEDDLVKDIAYAAYLGRPEKQGGSHTSWEHFNVNVPTESKDAHKSDSRQERLAQMDKYIKK